MTKRSHPHLKNFGWFCALGPLSIVPIIYYSRTPKEKVAGAEINIPLNTFFNEEGIAKQPKEVVKAIKEQHKVDISTNEVSAFQKRFKQQEVYALKEDVVLKGNTLSTPAFDALDEKVKSGELIRGEITQQAGTPIRNALYTAGSTVAKILIDPPIRDAAYKVASGIASCLPEGSASRNTRLSEQNKDAIAQIKGALPQNTTVYFNKSDGNLHVTDAVKEKVPAIETAPSTALTTSRTAERATSGALVSQAF